MTEIQEIEDVDAMDLEEEMEREDIPEEAREYGEEEKVVRARIRALLDANPEFAVVPLNGLERFADLMKDMSLQELIYAEEELNLRINRGKPWTDLEKAAIRSMNFVQKETGLPDIEEEVLSDDEMRMSFRKMTHSLLVTVPAPIEFMVKWVAKTFVKTKITGDFWQWMTTPSEKEIEGDVTIRADKAAHLLQPLEAYGIRRGGLQQNEVQSSRVENAPAEGEGEDL